MSQFKSLIYGLKEARCNPVTVLHSMSYAATVTYLRVLKQIVRIPSTTLRNHVGETYHSKVVRLADAKKIITINRDIEIRNLEQLLPYRHAKDIILKNPHNIVVYECPCRAQKKDPCRPTDVCLVIGDPFVDLLRMFHPYRSRRISQEEALKILTEEDKRGHIHTAWFKRAMIDRFYAICNCCQCCCLGMKFAMDHGIDMIRPSGYLAAIGDACNGCSACMGRCQFGAIGEVDDGGQAGNHKKCFVVEERCFGCGVCERACCRGAISMHAAPEKGAPLDIEALALLAAT